MPSTSDMERIEGVLDENKARRTRRKRLQLSCGECRSKKLSCDREIPCKRCKRSGKADECVYETKKAGPRTTTPDANHHEHGSVDARLQRLRAEVSRLNDLLHSSSQYAGGCMTPSSLLGPSPNTVPISSTETQSELHHQHDLHLSSAAPEVKLPSGSYSQTSLVRYFEEIPRLLPFVQETMREWLLHFGVNLKKNKHASQRPTIEIKPGCGSLFEELLPSKSITDTLVSVYLRNFECLHRIVHVPTFQRCYEAFWVPGNARSTTMTIQILSMSSIAASVSQETNINSHAMSLDPTMPVRWIYVCDDWLRQSSSKGFELERYQAMCLIYLAKRMNTFRKKRFWQETGSLVQQAIMDGLHREVSKTGESPYQKEMRRRIWSTIREVDLQNSYEYCLPSLLHSFDSTVEAPANIDDIEFDDSSVEMPRCKPTSEYTCSSYQHITSLSWGLRRQISRRLQRGSTTTLSYAEVLEFTNKITAAISALPFIQNDNIEKAERILGFAYLQFQLQECILAVHRPYLRTGNEKFWASDTICYQTSRDMLLMHIKLGQLGLQSLTNLREDLFSASLCITRVSLLQEADCSSLITIASDATIDILEQCLSFVESRYSSRANGEPWCFMTMFACIMLAKIHYGKETKERSKSLCAQRFLALHGNHIGSRGGFASASIPGTSIAANESSSNPMSIDFPSGDFDGVEDWYTNIDSGIVDFATDLNIP